MQRTKSHGGALCALAGSVSLAFIGAAGAETLTYNYNALGRLTAVSSDSGPNTGYTYDSAGNRTKVETALSGNRNPVANDDGSPSSRFNVTTGSSIDIDVLANDTDPDGDARTITNAGSPSQGVTSIVSGKIRYQATGSGVDQFTYAISDGHGGTASATVYVNVGTVTPAPPTTSNASITTAYNTTGSVGLSVGGSYSGLAIDTGPAHGSASVNTSPSPTASYTRSSGYTGGDSFTYHAVGPGGSSNVSTVSVTVSSRPNSPPVTSPDFIDMWSQDARDIYVLTNDTDPDGDTLTVDSITPGPLSWGTYTLAAGNVIVANTGFLPNPHTDTIAYVVSDGHGGTANGTLTVQLTPGEPPH